MATQEQLAAALAQIDNAFAGRAKPVSAPISREEAAAIRADLDARQRAGQTVMLRNNKGHFIGSVKVATFGAAAPIPAHNARKAEAPRSARTPVSDDIEAALAARQMGVA